VVSVLAVRYPKLVRAYGTAGNALGSFTEQPGHILAVRPRAYSNVRAMWSWVEFVNNVSTGFNFHGEWFPLRRFAGVGQPVQYWQAGSGGSFEIHGVLTLQAADVLYTADPTGPINTLSMPYQSIGGNLMDLGAWRDVWNAAGEDDYLVLMPATSYLAGSGTAAVCPGAGLVMVQAPDATNRTTTFYNAWSQVERPTANNTEYDCTPKRQFQYLAAEFNNLTSLRITLCARLNIQAADVTLTVRLRHATGGSGTVIYSQVITVLKTASNGVGLWRSPDLQALLVDGERYWLTLEVSDINLLVTNVSNYFAMEFEQQTGFTRTTTFYHARERDSVSSGVNIITSGGDLFAPLHFQNIENFHRPFRQWMNVTDATADLIQSELRTKAPTEADAARACAFNGSPLMVSALGNTDAWYQADLANSSRIPNGCNGDRHFYVAMTSTYVAGGIFGDHVLAIGFDVPTGTSPLLGDLFSEDAFDPIGCVSTAAGGGVPGMLIIGNGAEIPKKFLPENETIEDAGIPPPFPGEVPSTTVASAGISPTGGLGIGSYEYVYTFRNCCTNKESDPSDVITVSTSGASPRAAITLSFAGIRIPGDTQICEICIYRTVLGGAYPVMAKVACFDPNVQTLYVDDLGDAELDFTNDPLSILQATPPCVPYLVHHKKRIFGAGNIPLQTTEEGGTVTATQGSKILEGSDIVVWDRCLEGKYIRLINGCRWYQIDRVLPPQHGTSPPIQRLRLVEPFKEASTAGKNYVVCGDANMVFFSEPNEPEAWPVVNQIPVEPGDGDYITGLASSFDRLIITKRTKTYTMAYTESPTDEVIDPNRISPDIGGIGPRTFAQIENHTVWLSDRGIALFDGRGVQHLPASDDIRNIFTDPDNPRYIRRNAQGLVPEAVGVNYPVRQQYWLGLPTKRNNRGFDIIIVWNYKTETITLYEFCQNFLSMVVAKDAEGNQRVYLGDEKGFVWVADIGHTDGAGVPGNTGSLRGLVTSSDEDFSFNDSHATFLEGGIPGLGGLSGLAGLSPFLDEKPMGLAGVCVYLKRPGETDWIVRTIWAATKQKIYFTPPLSPAPEVGTEYMIAPIDFMAEVKPTNLSMDKNTKRPLDFYVIHEPEEFDSELKVEILPDFQNEDERAGAEITLEGQTVPGDRVVLMSNIHGRQRIATGRVIYTYVGYRLSNFAPEEPIRVLNLAPTVEVRP
jgi:hypothetical protein